MKKTQIIVLAASALLAGFANGQTPEYQRLKAGEILPDGWIKQQMLRDLEGGITGNLDSIHNSVSQNVFAAQNRTPGTWEPGSRGPKVKEWWPAEFEGNWMDGFSGAALLTGSDEDIARVRAWVDAIMKRYEETGYIGNYAPETRFPDKGFDGEYWAQSRAMETLLAWYEYTGDQKVLDAVCETVRMTINHYREKGSYFIRPGVDGGITHGVGYMDTLEWLWRLTGDQFFADAAIWMYEDYNNYKGMDLQVDNMLDADKPWKDHAPHTAESIHMPAIAAFFGGNEKFAQAAKNVRTKLLRHTNPGGGVTAGHLESIAEVDGGGDECAEYCAKADAVKALSRLIQYDPDPAWGDWMERCTLNAAQGARFHPVDDAVIYLSRDNRLRADHRMLHGGREIFSAAHRTAACCVANAPRMLPAYVNSMWYRSGDGDALFANLYGPSTLKTQIGDTDIQIVQKTGFPFSDEVVMEVEPGEPAEFEVVLRIPPNTGEVKVEAPGATEVRDENTIRLSKTWEAGDRIKIDFDFQVARHLQHDGRQAYYMWGPLVFALPIPTEKTPFQEIEMVDQPTGYHDFFLKPKDTRLWATLDNPSADFELVRLDGDPNSPWENPLVALRGTLTHAAGQSFDVELQPMGGTLLRRTTFPLTREDYEAANKKHEGISFSDEDDPMRAY